MTRVLIERWSSLFRHFVLWLALCLAGSLQARADDEWRFVLPEPGAEHDYPPLRAIPLSADKPEDVKEKAEYRGSSRRYAQLRYGSPSAARVAIVVDQISPGEVDLYVDANRNRTIEPKERMSGEGRLWRVRLKVEYADGEVFRRFPREMILRLGTTGRTLSCAAAGYLEGKLPLPLGEGRGEGALKQQAAGADGKRQGTAAPPHPNPLVCGP